MTEKLSQFLDNDLSHHETLSLLQEVAEQPELKDKLIRYAAISHAMKTDDFLWVSTDFATRIQQEIQQIPETAIVHVLPVSRRRNYGLAFLAAASVAAIAILAGSSLHWSAKQTMQPAALQITQQQSPKTTIVRVSPQKAAHNTRINDYLQEHNNSGYSNGEAFVRLATYNQQ